jgi:membrane protein DedA with SNARE-associated domain
VTFLESLLFVGAFVPATALLVVAGGLVGAGMLDPVPVLAGCVLGAALGDAISYNIGRRLGPAALRHRWFAQHSRKVALTRLFCRRFGTASVYVGRFFGPLRAIVPVMVGALGMSRRRFQIANICSAALWVLAMLAPGYTATLGLARLELFAEADPFTLSALAAGGLVAVGVVAWRLMRWRAARSAPALPLTDAAG